MSFPWQPRVSPYLVHSPHTRLFILIAVSYKRYLVKIASESWKEKHKANKGKREMALTCVAWGGLNSNWDSGFGLVIFLPKQEKKISEQPGGRLRKNEGRVESHQGWLCSLESNTSSQSHVWPGLLSPLLRRGVCGSDGGNLLCVGQQSGIRRLCRVRQSVMNWEPERTSSNQDRSPTSEWHLLLGQHFKQF